MKIQIEIIPHAEQIYDTAGDWRVDAEGTLQIRVSKMKDPRHEALIALHELIEVIIETVKIRYRLDIPTLGMVEAADAFDKAELERGNEGEPGYNPKAPYWRGHMVASAVEHMAAMLWGVNYDNYANEIAAL